MLSKLTQQAFQLPIKGMLRPQALIFLIFLSQIERKTVLRVREKRKEKFQEKQRDRGVDLLKERKKKKPTSSSHFFKPKPKVT